MLSCQCCLKPHPRHLLERYDSSIQTIKLLQKTCSIFENFLLDEYEQFERIISNFNKYLMKYGPITNLVFSYLSQLIIQLNNRLENLRKFLYKFECLIIKCSIWLKNNSTKQIHSQLKTFRKQFDSFEKFVDQNNPNLTRKFWKNFLRFQQNYHQQTLQMDLIEYEHIKLFLDSIQIFSSIISFEYNEHICSSMINIEQNINEWKEQNKFHITWLPNEHQQKEKSIKQSLSDIDIKPIDDYSSQDTYAYESNLSWSFTIPKPNEDLSILSTSTSSQSTDNFKPTITTMPINRVRLAIEAIEQNTKNFPRGRKS